MMPYVPLFRADIARIAQPGHRATTGLVLSIAPITSEVMGPSCRARQVDPPMHSGKKTGIYARFSVQYPQYFASLTVGVHGRFSEVWAYGRRQKLKSWQICECNEEALREIAACLRTA